MSTYSPQTDAAATTDARVAIVTAEWNTHITSRLRDEAVATLLSHGLTDDRIGLFDVPGAVELTYAAARLAGCGYDAVIVFGCVLRGDTPHFDYVCQSVTQGVTDINLQGKTPVIFGVLTVDTEQQAIDRIGGPAENKGAEAALTALKMIAFDRSTKHAAEKQPETNIHP